VQGPGRHERRNWMSPLMPRGFGCAHASRGDGLAAKHAVVNMAVRWWAGSTVRVESRRADTISLYGDAGVVVSASGKEKPQTDSAQIEHNSQPQPQHRLDAKSESRCPVCRLPSHPTPHNTSPTGPLEDPCRYPRCYRTRLHAPTARPLLGGRPSGEPQAKNTP
jgi:hypothetical protein